MEASPGACKSFVGFKETLMIEHKSFNCKYLNALYRN